MKRLLFILSLLCCAATLQAQEQTPAVKSPQQAEDPASSASDLLQMDADDYLNMQLPPLGVLIDNSKQSSQMKYYNTVIDEAESDLKSERRKWLQYFRGTANYQYGQMNYLSSLAGSGEGIDPIPVPYGSKKQSYWNVGGVLSIPLNDLFDRHNRVKRQKLAVEAAEHDMDRWQDELSLKIIDAYTAVLQNLSMIKTQAEALTLATAQYKFTEADFMNGKVDAVTLSRQKNIESATAREYEQTRAMLNNALLRLEILSHTKILTK